MIGNRIRQARLAAGLTLDALGEGRRNSHGDSKIREGDPDPAFIATPQVGASLWDKG